MKKDAKPLAQKLKVLFSFGRGRSENEKLSKKAEKISEKVLTFLWDGDNLYKLTREAARPRGKH